jgi:hypothetical protein
MAKSIRSKVKKRNRSEMRKTVGKPHQQKELSKCTSKIYAMVKRQKGGEGIRSLKKMLKKAQEANPLPEEKPKFLFVHKHPHLVAKEMAAPKAMEQDDEDTEEDEEEQGEEMLLGEGEEERGAGVDPSDDVVDAEGLQWSVVTSTRKPKGRNKKKAKHMVSF